MAAINISAGLPAACYGQSPDGIECMVIVRFPSSSKNWSSRSSKVSLFVTPLWHDQEEIPSRVSTRKRASSVLLTWRYVRKTPGQPLDSANAEKLSGSPWTDLHISRVLPRD